MAFQAYKVPDYPCYFPARPLQQLNLLFQAYKVPDYPCYSPPRDLHPRHDDVSGL